MKSIFLLPAFLFFSSCSLVPSISFPNYLVNSKTNNLKVDTSKGNWLFLETKIPFELQIKAHEQTNLLLKSKLGDRLIDQKKTPILIPQKLFLEIDENVLDDLKNTTNIDFLVLLEVDIKRNDFADYSMIPSSDNGTQKQVVSEINIYRISDKILIYNKQVKGIISANQSEGPVYTKNINKLTKKSYEKLINEFSNDLQNFD